MYAVNNELQKARRLFEGELFGPESFAVDNDGKLYQHNRTSILTQGRRENVSYIGDQHIN